MVLRAQHRPVVPSLQRPRDGLGRSVPEAAAPRGVDVGPRQLAGSKIPASLSAGTVRWRRRRASGRAATALSEDVGVEAHRRDPDRFGHSAGRAPHRCPRRRRWRTAAATSSRRRVTRGLGPRLGAGAVPLTSKARKRPDRIAPTDDFLGHRPPKITLYRCTGLGLESNPVHCTPVIPPGRESRDITSGHPGPRVENQRC